MTLNASLDHGLRDAVFGKRLQHFFCRLGHVLDLGLKSLVTLLASSLHDISRNDVFQASPHSPLRLVCNVLVHVPRIGQVLHPVVGLHGVFDDKLNLAANVGLQVPRIRLDYGLPRFVASRGISGEFAETEVDVAPSLGDCFHENDRRPRDGRAATAVLVLGLLRQALPLAAYQDRVHGVFLVPRHGRGDSQGRLDLRLCASLFGHDGGRYPLVSGLRHKSARTLPGGDCRGFGFFFTHSVSPGLEKSSTKFSRLARSVSARRVAMQSDGFTWPSSRRWI